MLINPSVNGNRIAVEPDREDLLWQLVIDLGLPRRPAPFDRERKRAVLLELLHLRETALRDPEFGAILRHVLQTLTEE